MISEGELLPFAALILAFALSYGLTRWVRSHAARLRLVQEPNHRSSHAAPTPTGGGIGIVGGAAASMLLLAGAQAQMAALMLPALILAGVGWRDDKASLPATLRLLVQLGVCIVAVGLVPPPAIDALPVGFWAVLVVLGGVWWINLFNFMDGIDGIAAQQAITMLLGAAWLSYGGTDASWWWCMIALASATFGFLVQNWPPAKIFMGDAGSTFLAFMLFVLALLSIREGALSYATWLILGALFITDSSLTLVRRMLARERWFEAHRSHAYQHLARRWGSHKKVTLLALAINSCYLLPLAAQAQSMPEFAASFLAAAYAPLIFGAWKYGAGKAN